MRRSNAVQPEALSVMASSDIHLQSEWLIDWLQKTDGNQGDVTTAS